LRQPTAKNIRLRTLFQYSPAVATATEANAQTFLIEPQSPPHFAAFISAQLYIFTYLRQQTPEQKSCVTPGNNKVCATPALNYAVSRNWELPNCIISFYQAVEFRKIPFARNKNTTSNQLALWISDQIAPYS